VVLAVVVPAVMLPSVVLPAVVVPVVATPPTPAVPVPPLVMPLAPVLPEVSPEPTLVELGIDASAALPARLPP